MKKLLFIFSIVSIFSTNAMADCDNGQYVDESDECANCPKGRYCPDKTNSYRCDTGSYQNEPQKTTCNPCPDGNTTCHDGTVTCQTGAESCEYPCGNAYQVATWESVHWYPTTNQVDHLCKIKTCNLGYWLDVNANKCKPCDAGSICKNGINKSSCPKGWYCPGPTKPENCTTASVHNGAYIGACVCPGGQTTDNPGKSSAGACTPAGAKVCDTSGRCYTFPAQ